MKDERYFCLEALETARTILLSAVEILPKLRAGYDKHRGTEKETDELSQLYKTVKKVQKEFISIIQALNEFGDEKQTLEMAQKLQAGLLRFKWLEQDYANLCGALAMFAESLPRRSSINTKTFGRLMNRVKMGHFPTDLAHVKRIKEAIVFPQIKVNLLDPCCGCGTALQLFADGENTATYGIEIDESRAGRAEEILDRVGYGTFFHSRISNRVFHAVFLNPPYMYVMKEGGGSHRAERSFLLDTLRYLMPGGILIYIIPYYRLTEDISTILTEHFDDLQVYRFLESEFKKYKQVVIFGRLKERDAKQNPKAAELLNYSLNPDAIPSIEKLPAGIYSLPAKETEVKQFKGSEFNVRELAAQLKKSDSIKQIFSTSRLDTMHRNPLLPLKIGQIGLIGGSGLMNGLIECDTPHIIKGRIIKQKVIESNPDFTNGTEEIREVTSNRMVFNVLTPYGFKTLA
ncbi:MAG: class I SAM-dependent methyltransferase [Oscillospiraceae bacterium]|nr:class I SAM-dependent methyltransferase [Oscillospiraceae bacterium]